MSEVQSKAGASVLPETIGRYRVIERIGQGGMGQVYRAVAEGPEGFRREVALKVILKGHAQDPLLVKMFQDEARIVARLTHPGIAQVHDFGIEGETLFLVMELVEGRSLQQLATELREKALRMPEEVALALGTQVASALSYAHAATDAQGREMGLVHRDIAPDNLLVGEQGFVKILDFGIVKAEGRATTTSLGMVKGKPAYMAPEQAQGLELDGRTDIFALGVVLWELLAGRPLWRGEDPVVVVGQLLNTPVLHLVDQVSELHAAAADAVMAMLEKDREQRPDAPASQAMLSRSMSSMRAGSPQEIVAAWLRGEIVSPPRVAPRPAQRLRGPPVGQGSAGEAKTEAWAQGALPGRPEEGPTRGALAEEGAWLPGERTLIPDEEEMEQAPLDLATPSPVQEEVSIARAGTDGTEVRLPVGAVTERRATDPALASSARGREIPWPKIGLAAGGLLLLLGVGLLGRALFLGEPEERELAADGKVVLQIETDPSGAALQVNGVPVAAPSPTSVETLALHEHEIMARLEGYVPTTLKVSYTQVDRPVRIRLEKLTRIEVITEPAGAEISVDGRVVIAETPGTFERPAGRYDLLARLEGWAPRSKAITVGSDPVTWSASLVQAAYLRVTSRPTGATVTVNGMDTGSRTPAKVAVTPRRKVSVELRLAGLRARKTVKAPEPGRRRSLHLRLVDPVKVLEKKIASFQDEIDRLDTLVEKANYQLDTGILSVAEEREKARGRDRLLQRQDRLARQIESLEDRLTHVRTAALEAENAGTDPRGATGS